MTAETKRRRKYTEDFKRDAVSLVTEQGYTLAEAARSLDINSNLLGRWKHRSEAEISGTGLKADEREELKRLRKEVHTLRMEKEILKNRPRGIAALREIRNTQRYTALRSDRGRLLFGGIDPVKKPGPGEAADPMLVA